MFTPEIINKFSSINTPFYYYDLAVLEENLSVLQKISRQFGYHIHYALKANANPPILELISKYGFGADCVSGNEIKRALEFNFTADKIVFAGVGKTDREISFAIKNNIQCINCESIVELDVINELARKEERRARVALRINPDLEANTHHYITTGKKDNKFGINLKELDDLGNRLSDYSNIQLIGLHTHIGSQIRDLEVFKHLALRLNEILDGFKRRGIIFSDLNLGGGLGIDYENPEKNAIPEYQNYFKLFHDTLKPFPNQQIHFELGRAIVASCGSLISRVLFVKKGFETEFAIIDAGMTELIRPALYQAYHKIINLTSHGPSCKYDVVGPVCESSDFLGKNVMLPETHRHDLLAILSTGAYAEVMASRYNLRDLAPAVYSRELK
ncbi:MAG: diaminopimelate decarboxylase [bacterium]|nr:MAG: diaminopimelate decarboxylase [bacterium]